MGGVRSGAYGGTGTSLSFISPAYDHGHILTDPGTASDASTGYGADRPQADTLNPPRYQDQPRSLSEPPPAPLPEATPPPLFGPVHPAWREIYTSGESWRDATNRN